MRYPNALFQRGRKRLPKERIRVRDFVYARHKPSTDWDHRNGLPDFSRIKIDQSFNWCDFSIPIWTRFNDEREYLSDYAVAAFGVKTIRESHKKCTLFDSQVLDVEHIPFPHNYSHCALIALKALSKKERRELRMALRHGCRVPLRPNEQQGIIGMAIDRIRMYVSRAM